MSEFLDAIDRVHCRFDKQRELIPTTIRWFDMNHDALQADVTMDRYNYPLSHSTTYTISTKLSMRVDVTDEILDRTQVDMEELVLNKFRAMIQEKLYGKLLEKISEMENKIIGGCSPLIAPWYRRQFDELREECGA